MTNSIVNFDGINLISKDGFLNAQNSDLLKLAWNSFGLYICQHLIQGKGVWIPKLGNFTFTGKNVDLSGVTNPHQRDKQERYPVFIIGKDFVSKVLIQPGIQQGIDQENYAQNYNKNKIRPFGVQGISGIIPKVKINYFEVAQGTNGVLSKNQCIDEIEIYIKKISNKVRNGQKVSVPIPYVGQLKIKNGIAGVVFNQELINPSKIQTAKNYQHRLTGNNWMNQKIFEPNTSNYGRLTIVNNFIKSSEVDLGLNNKQINNDLQQSPLEIISNYFRQSSSNVKNQDFQKKMKFKTLEQNLIQSRASSQILAHINENLSRISQQYQSVLHKPQSSLSRQNSVISKIPDLAPFQLMNLANQVYQMRQKILEAIKLNYGNLSIREKLNTSKIHRILIAAGYHINFAEMKALLKELGFAWNGASCTIQQLFKQLKEYLVLDGASVNSIRDEESALQNQQQSIIKLKQDQPLLFTTTDIIKEIFYASGKQIYQIFREAVLINQLKCQQFLQLVKQYSKQTLSDQEISEAFVKSCLKYGKQDYLTFQQFKEVFGMEVPQQGSTLSEQQIIKRVREWMFTNQYTSQVAFQKLLDASNRITEQSLRQEDIHYSFLINKVGLQAPEIDFLYQLLAETNQQTEISYSLWSKKFVDSSVNPLQQLREIIGHMNLDKEGLLKEMKIKLWDSPLDFQKFSSVIKRIDQYISDSQLKSLFEKFKNQQEAVEVVPMFQNIHGTLQDTVDFKQNMLKELYEFINSNNKQQKLISLFENEDLKNDGKIDPDKLQSILKNITGGSLSRYSDVDLKKFINQIQKDNNNKISYIQLIENIKSSQASSDNSVKELIKRLKLFLQNNKLQVSELLNRFTKEENEKLVRKEKFAEFLKVKIDKKRELSQLIADCSIIDIDKDGFISEQDLQTCICNLSSNSYFQAAAKPKSQFNSQLQFYSINSELFISNAKAFQICKQIRDKLNQKKISLSGFFNMCDTKQMGMINLTQFITGVNSVISITSPLIEKIFILMDKNHIGMVDFYKFNNILKAEAPEDIQTCKRIVVEDNFDWQENILQLIKEWVQKQKISAQEAFKLFDQNFDGLICFNDMEISLQQYLQIKKQEITSYRLERLFRLLSFFKTDKIQPTDFERIIENINPYIKAPSQNSQLNLQLSMGGSLLQKSTHDWIFAALQQIGLTISQRYEQIQDSFQDASNGKGKIDFQSFVNFINKHNALSGFNLTKQLQQKVFAEIDPHKKTFLDLNDWINAFQTFTVIDNLVVEFKNFIQILFINSNSAFAFFQSLSNGKDIDVATFQNAVESLITSRKYTQKELNQMFQYFAKNKSAFDQNDFATEFQNVQFKGKQKFNYQSLKQGQVKKIGNTQKSKWEKDVIDMLKRIIKKSGKPLDFIFEKFDTNNSGDITIDEFRQALKMISLGISDSEIEKIMKRIDANNDGTICYNEFAAQFRDDPFFDLKINQRASKKLTELKEKMILFMNSPIDAFRLFDSSRSGSMNFFDWQKLIKQLSQLSKVSVPSYSVVKDMFDIIDKNKDQTIDLNEWNSYFGGVINPSGQPTSLVYWENSSEAIKIQKFMARNRKILIQQFKNQNNNERQSIVTLRQSKIAVDSVLKDQVLEHQIKISEPQLASIMKVGLLQEKFSNSPHNQYYDYMKMLDIYKQRYS